VSRRILLMLLVGFLLTRAPSAWLADHPERYRGVTGVQGDVTLYAFWAERITDGSVPYSEVPVEYPPASLPFIVAPQLPPAGTYRTNLIGLMLLVDAAGLLGLILIARRWGSTLGPWAWIVGLPLLGPIVYLRLDLVPAVATVWAIERAASRSWGGVGAWLGFGAAAKLYPALLLPAPLLVATKRRAVAVGALIVLAVALVPFAGVPRGLLSNVAGYHLGRDIQIESIWGVALLVASRFGHDVRIVFAAGSFNAVSSVSPVLKPIALVVLLLALAAATWLSVKAVHRGNGKGLSAGFLATLALAVGLATVFSPQYVLWLIAPGAAALCVRRSVVRSPALMLAPVALLTQVLYPFQYHRLLAVEAPALIILSARNVLVLALGVWALRRLRAVRDETGEGGRRDRVSERGSASA
jgi:uncharacterized membrane protein